MTDKRDISSIQKYIDSFEKTDQPTQTLCKSVIQVCDIDVNLSTQEVNAVCNSDINIHSVTENICGPLNQSITSLKQVSNDSKELNEGIQEKVKIISDKYIAEPDKVAPYIKKYEDIINQEAPIKPNKQLTTAEKIAQIQTVNDQKRELIKQISVLISPEENPEPEKPEPEKPEPEKPAIQQQLEPAIDPSTQITDIEQPIPAVADITKPTEPLKITSESPLKPSIAQIIPIPQPPPSINDAKANVGIAIKKLIQTVQDKTKPDSERSDASKRLLKIDQAIQTESNKPSDMKDEDGLVRTLSRHLNLAPPVEPSRKLPATPKLFEDESVTNIPQPKPLGPPSSSTEIQTSPPKPGSQTTPPKTAGTQTSPSKSAPPPFILDDIGTGDTGTGARTGARTGKEFVCLGKSTLEEELEKLIDITTNTSDKNALKTILNDYKKNNQIILKVLSK